MEQKNLELTIRLDDYHIEVDVYEPETGEFSQLDYLLSFDEHPEFNQAIGDTIYEWLRRWKEDECDG